MYITSVNLMAAWQFDFSTVVASLAQLWVWEAM